MDYEKIERALADKVKNAFVEFNRLNPEPTPPKGLSNREMMAWKGENITPRMRALNAFKGRYAEMLTKVRKHRAVLADRASTADSMESLRDALRGTRDAVQSGARLVAFDIERGWRASTNTVAGDTASRRLIVDDITGFKVGHPIWITLPKPMNTRKERSSPPVVLSAVVDDVREHLTNTSSRPRGMSGSIFIREKLSVPVDSLVTGRSATREIGITTYQNGAFESINLRAENATKANWIGFEYGETERLPLEQIMVRLRAALTAADYYVGHSLGVDIGHLTEIGVPIPRRPVLDTFTLASLVPELHAAALSGANLSTLASHFGVEASAPHCGGNDARYNMEVLLAMVEAYA